MIPRLFLPPFSLENAELLVQDTAEIRWSNYSAPIPSSATDRVF